MINTYCYIMSTFTLPRALAGDVGKDVAAPGVGAYDSKTDTYTVKVTSSWNKEKFFNNILLGLLPMGSLCIVPPSWHVLRSPLIMQNVGRRKGGWIQFK